MKRLVLLVPMLLPMTGCQNLTCKLLGLFQGQFGGSQTGDVMIEVTENPDDSTADAEIRLSMDPLSAGGDAVVSCEGGEFMTMLERTDGEDPVVDFGQFSGLLGLDDGDGEWSFNEDLDGDGELESGFWNLTRMQ
jgi:hypothetical protein